MKRNQKNPLLKIIFLTLFLSWLFFGEKNNNLLAKASSPTSNTIPAIIYSQQIPVTKKNTDPFSPSPRQFIILSNNYPSIQLVTKKQKPTTRIIIIKKSSAIVTAYSSTIDQTDSTPFINASGKRVRFGTVACNFLPLGTIIRFDNFYPYLFFIVEDRMNKKFNNRIDIWFPTRIQAKIFGKRKMNYQIIKVIK